MPYIRDQDEHMTTHQRERERTLLSDASHRREPLCRPLCVLRVLFVLCVAGVIYIVCCVCCVYCVLSVLCVLCVSCLSCVVCSALCTDHRRFCSLLAASLSPCRRCFCHHRCSCTAPRSDRSTDFSTENYSNLHSSTFGLRGVGRVDAGERFYCPFPRRATAICSGCPLGWKRGRGSLVKHIICIDNLADTWNLF